MRWNVLGLTIPECTIVYQNVLVLSLPYPDFLATGLYMYIRDDSLAGAPQFSVSCITRPGVGTPLYYPRTPCVI